jgi:O-antigen/teichoic acid export membrane protein
MKNKITPKLEYGSTWKLLGLGIITYAVYLAHYIKKQTGAINDNCEENERLSDSFITFIMVISYVSLGFFFAYLFVDETHPIVAISSFVDSINNVAFIVWGFKARNRMNVILSAQKGEREWFHGLWTFLFSPLYFNFKVNKLNGR